MPLSIRRDFHAASMWAGFTTFLWYAFGAVPLQIAVAEQLGLSTPETSSWMFIVWFGGALSSIILSLHYRQPISITWTIPGLVYLGTLAGRFSFAELVGANLVAGVLMLVLGILGVGGRVMKWLPLPIVMGMFAGSILGYVTRLVSATVSDLFVAGGAVAGYLVGRFIANPRVPPVGLAVVSGGLAVIVGGRATAVPITWSLPAVDIAAVEFSMPALLAVSIPMVVLAMGLGNVQGLGFLISQGYRAPVNRVSIVVGVNSIVNALLGGHPATVARAGMAIVASPEAGPVSSRYLASAIAATLSIVIAFAAAPVASLIQIVPRSYVFALGGLAILSALQDAFEKSFRGRLRFGALVTFAVAATPFTLGGITSAFWAIIVGLIAALLAERHELFQHWGLRDSAP
jgi:benzoate membrane transport protein